MSAQRGSAGQAVTGAAWPRPLPSVTYRDEPKPKPKGLDWAKHTAPAAPVVVPIGNGYAGEQPAARRTAPKKPAVVRQPRTVPAAETASIIADYQAGQTLAELTKKHRRSRETIYRLLDDAGIPRRGASMRTYPKVSDDPTVVAKIVELYTVDGLTQEQIAHQLGHAPFTIGQILRDRNVPRPDGSESSARPRGYRGAPIDVPSVIEAYEGGQTIGDIAAAIECPRMSVRRALTRAGVALRDDRSRGRGAHSRRIDEQRPSLVDDIRRLYIDKRLSQAAVAAELGVSQNAVIRAMKRHNIPARAPKHSVTNGIARYRDRIAAAGITSAELRAWGAANGHHIPSRGLPAITVLDAYEAARR